MVRVRWIREDNFFFFAYSTVSQGVWNIIVKCQILIVENNNYHFCHTSGAGDRWQEGLGVLICWRYIPGRSCSVWIPAPNTHSWGLITQNWEKDAVPIPQSRGQEVNIESKNNPGRLRECRGEKQQLWAGEMLKDTAALVSVLLPPVMCQGTSSIFPSCLHPF